MKITFLGTSSASPTRSRNVTSIALQLPQRAALWLFDCGEGTQHQILRSPLRLSQLEKVFLTHLHGDHLFGVMGMLASRSMQNGGTTPVTLYGPNGLAEYVRVTMQVCQMRLGFPVKVETIKPGLVCEDDRFRVSCAAMQHGVEAYGFAVEEQTLPGRFDVEKAQALGIPPGPIYSRLKKGETITLGDGRVVEGKELTGQPVPGRKFVYCGDTTFTPRAVELARDADLLVHEATYLEEDRDLADRARHATARMAASVAQQANARALILTHFSARYESEAGSRLQDLLAEAQEVFPNAHLARDYWSYEIPRRIAPQAQP
jgi:ribonuclease Z